MPQTEVGWLLVIGAFFLLLGTLGGGFEASNIKIPAINKVARYFSLAIGTILLVAALIRLFSPPAAASPVVPTPTVAPVPASAPTKAPAPAETASPTAAPVANKPTPEPALSGLTANAKRVYGPAEGKLAHIAGQFVYNGANTKLGNFAASAQFFNPYAVSDKNWSYGIMFRRDPLDMNAASVKAYVVYVRSVDRSWVLRKVEKINDKLDWSIIARGELPALDVSANGGNTLDIVARDKKLMLFVNSKLVTDALEISAITQKGDVEVVTSVDGGDEWNGKSTDYKNFQVWSFDP